jgi:hypothetical protein
MPISALIQDVWRRGGVKGGGRAVQDVLEHHFHQFYQQIKKTETAGKRRHCKNTPYFWLSGQGIKRVPPPPPSYLECALKTVQDAAITSQLRPEIII